MMNGPYWNGESDHERVVRELLEQRRHGWWSLFVVVVQAVALALFALAFVWVLASM